MNERHSSGVNEDMSDDAIMERYNKANRIAVAISDRVVFASLSDIFYLLKQNNHLRNRVESLEKNAEDYLK